MRKKVCVSVNHTVVPSASVMLSLSQKYSSLWPGWKWIELGIEEGRAQTVSPG